MNKVKIITTCLLLLFLLSGCVVTKVLTVPIRITGAVISVIPVAGNKIDSAMDKYADKIDEAPI